MFKANCVIGIIAPEVSLKSNKVQLQIHSVLKNNIIYILKKNNIIFSSVVIKAGRVFVYTSEINKTIDLLKTCFGLYYLIPALSEKCGLENICKRALDISKNIIEGEFAVRCKSFLKEKKSKDFEIEIGSKIIENIPNVKVNLSNPEKQLNLIVFNDKVFFYFDSFEGAKGFPVSSQGNVVFISKNIENSKKIIYSLLKCGCKVFVVSKTKFDFDSFFVKNISLEQSLDFYKNNSVAAFFCDLKSLKKKVELDKKLGLKVFAPLLE
jgi:adenylyl- and sulfurtransferase ThiI